MLMHGYFLEQHIRLHRSIKWVCWIHSFCIHLSQHLVKPLQRTTQMNFNPARCTCNILAMILSPPAFDKTQPNGTHLYQIIYSLKIIINRLRKQLCKFLVVENFQGTAWRDLTHCCRVKTMAVVAISTLHKDGRVTEAFSKNLSTHVVQMHTFSNMSPCTLNGWVTTDIG